MVFRVHAETRDFLSYLEASDRYIRRTECPRSSGGSAAGSARGWKLHLRAFQNAFHAYGWALNEPSYFHQIPYHIKYVADVWISALQFPEVRCRNLDLNPTLYWHLRQITGAGDTNPGVALNVFSAMSSAYAWASVDLTLLFPAMSDSPNHEVLITKS